jgi:two-component system, OmpR family, phosphate regulon sensor histidine kinase PhoR
MLTDNAPSNFSSFDTVQKIGTRMLESESLLLDRWRQRVRALETARDLDVPTLNDHIPLLIRDIASAFIEYGAQNSPDKGAPGTQETDHGMVREASDSAEAHGVQRLSDGFDLSEVVAEYSMIRDVIFEFAAESGLKLGPETISCVNSVIDVAISRAVKTYAAHRAAQLSAAHDQHLAFVSHDLRTPLQAISLTVSRLILLGNAAGNDGNTLKAATVLQRNVDQLVKLVEGILNPQNPATESGVPKPHARDVNLWPLVERIVLECLPIANNRGVKVVNAVDVQLSAYIDAPMLSRVLQNLLSNAIQAEDGGEIIITGAPASDDIGVSLSVSNPRAVLSEEQIQRLTKPGTSNSENGTANGHGLDIVRLFMAAMNGRIRVQSAADAGTHIELILPVRN